MKDKEYLIRNICDIVPAFTTHGSGGKRVLIANNETCTPITQIAVTELKKGENVEEHSHPTMEEYFIFLNGECTAVIDGNEELCKEGTFLKVPAKTIHSLQPSTDIRIITIGIATE